MLLQELGSWDKTGERWNEHQGVLSEEQSPTGKGNVHQRYPDVQRVADETVTFLRSFSQRLLHFEAQVGEFPNSSPRYGNENLSYPARDFSYTSTGVSTEDELNESEDGSTSIGISHFTTGTRQCHTCGTSGTWHTPRDCPAVSRCCHRCGKVGHLGKACSANTHLKIPKPVQLNGTADKATPQFAYSSDEDSSEGDKSPTPTDTASTTGSTNSSQYVYPESHESQDSERSQKRQTTYAEMGRIINFMNGHDGLHVSREDILVLGDLETSLLNKWRSVLNEIGDKDGKLTAEDQCLMAVLGMAIGHTRKPWVYTFTETK